MNQDFLDFKGFIRMIILLGLELSFRNLDKSEILFIFIGNQLILINQMEKDDLTYRINGCAMKVHTKLGRGFREYVYCRALAIELRRAGILFEKSFQNPTHPDQNSHSAALGNSTPQRSSVWRPL